jgi:hypothetical protein
MSLKASPLFRLADGGWDSTTKMISPVSRFLDITRYTASNGKSIIGYWNWKLWKTMSWCHLRKSLSWHLPGGSTKGQENFNQNSCSQGRDFNQGLIESARLLRHSTVTFDLQLNRKLQKGRGSPFWRGSYAKETLLQCWAWSVHTGR